MAGELGCEHIAAWAIILPCADAGSRAGCNIREYGFNALLSLRLEKVSEFGLRNLPKAIVPGQPAWIDGLTGTSPIYRRDAVIAERDGNGPAQKLVTPRQRQGMQIRL